METKGKGYENIVPITTGEFYFEDYPLIRFVANDVSATVEDVIDYHNALISVLENTEGKFIYFVDGTNSSWLSSEARIEMGKRQKMREQLFPGRYHKIIAIIPNALVRMMLKGVNLVSKTTVDQLIFSNKKEAEQALSEELKKMK